MHPAQRLNKELQALPKELTDVLYDALASELLGGILGYVATSNGYIDGPCLYMRSNSRLVEHLDQKGVEYTTLRDMASFQWVCI